MFDFFIDTADTDYIEALWKRLGHKIDPKHMLGVTTNPGIFYKTGDLSLEAWMIKARKLAKLIRTIRGDAHGELHVQYPHSDFDESQYLSFLTNVVEKIHDVGMAREITPVVKVPPFPSVLNIAIQRACRFNVTGVSDASTALLARTYNPHYISIIPGRMEEHGLDAKSHVAYVQQRIDKNEEDLNFRFTNIITGSMRTLECLKWCVGYGTIPTIGTRVWDLMTEENIDEIVSWKVGCVPMTPTKFGPRQSEEHSDLSIAFFQEMDAKGKQCHEDLQKMMALTSLSD